MANHGVTIVDAVAADCPRLLSYLWREFYGAYADHLPPVDAPAAMSWVESHVKHGHALMAMRRGEIVGTIAGRVTTFWWTRSRHVQDGWFFVSPAARASPAAAWLLDNLEDYARGLLMPLAIGVITPDDQFERKVRFFKRHGYRQMGALFMKDFK